MNAYRYEDDAAADEWDEEDDLTDDDSTVEPTVECPYCRRQILEDTPRCPYCEQYISEEDRTTTRQPRWVIVTALLCLATAIYWVLTAF